MGNPPRKLGIRIHTDLELEPPPVTPEQYTSGLSQHPSGLPSRTQVGKGSLIKPGGPVRALRISIWRVCHRQHGIMMITMALRLITSPASPSYKTRPQSAGRAAQGAANCSACTVGGQGKWTCRRKGGAPARSRGVASDVHTSRFRNEKGGVGLYD